MVTPIFSSSTDITFMTCLTRVSRAEEITSATESRAISLLSAERSCRPMRSSAASGLWPTDTKNCRGSAMRHFTKESTWMLIFSAVMKRSISSLS